MLPSVYMAWITRRKGGQTLKPVSIPARIGSLRTYPDLRNHRQVLK